MCRKRLSPRQQNRQGSKYTPNVEHSLYTATASNDTALGWLMVTKKGRNVWLGTIHSCPSLFYHAVMPIPSHRPQRTEKLAVLLLRADGDAQTVVTQLDTGAVAHDDSFIDKIVVGALGIVNLRQEEVGIGGINLLAYLHLARPLDTPQSSHQPRLIIQTEEILPAAGSPAAGLFV